MESAAISGASWVVGKALSPLSDGLVEAWAASSELGPNVEALKMELLYAQAMLNNARGREIHNPALAELLQRLRGLAYGAEDVLDELDYFRIQDELEGTFETVDDRGCARNLVRDARLTAKAAGKQLQCTSCFTSAARAAGGVPYEHGEQGVRRRGLLCGAWPGAAGADDEPACKCVRGLASRARTTAHAVGKRFLCSSLPTVRNDQVDDDDDDDPSTNKNGKQVIRGACSCTCMAPRKKQVPKTPKLDFDRVEISRKMKHIVEQLQPICAKVSTVLELELLSSNRSIGHDTSTGRSITISESTEPKLYGRDHEKNTIVQAITKDECFDKDLTVLPIVGPGGIGKTTLTQYIYNNQEVQQHFQIRVWVCVSLDFNVYRLTQEIAKTIPRAEDEKNDTAIDGLQNLDQLQKLVEKRLKNKRFLLVLDDIWNYGNESEWNKLLVPFTKGQVKGNTILVTTRFLEVAEMVKGNNEVIQLDRLKPEDFWDFFIACVFGHGETKQHLENNDLNSIGKQIVEKLKGSPLAAKTVGRLLRNNLTSSYWTRVLESKEWESRTSDDDIMPALKLSYDYLPFHLQQCFSYCALYPEDYKFDCEELIRFWIGLDILRPSHETKRIEDIGLEYLNELVNYGFFKKEIEKQGIYVGIRRKEKEEWVIKFVIHDLLHDLALKVSSQECLHIASSGPTPIEIPPSIYHLSISMSPANSEDGTMGENFRKELGKIRNRMKSENLHTLMMFGEYDASFVGTFNDLFKDAKSLRVVNLFTMSQPVESILHNFSKLVHLRYLRLASKYVSISDLPSSLSRFYHLRVLDIASWHGAHSLLGDMTNLVKLRHFLVPIYDNELHSNISNVGKLHCLQELRRFQVKKENNGFELRELGQLAELGGSLGIYNLENVQVNEAHEAKLLYKNRLQKLTLNWNKDRSNKNPDKEAAVLESLRPHSNLRELCIDGHGGFTCPTWLDAGLSIKGLEVLHLVGVAWKSLPSLRQMWVLNELTLEGIDTLSEFGPFGLITEQSFHNLKRLTFIGLKRLEKWVVGDTYQLFSALQVLVIRDCPELLELPFMSNSCYLPEQDGNINWLPNLQVFEIADCPKVLSLPPIPWTHTLCYVNMRNAGPIQYRLEYYINYSSEVELEIHGNDNLRSLDEKELVFNSLTKVHVLTMWGCPPPELKHLQMLTSLKALKVGYSKNGLGNLGDVEWQLPVERLLILDSGASGKELTQLLSHLPKLSNLFIFLCEKVTWLVVEAEQQRTAKPISLPSCSAIEMADTQATADQNQQIAGEVEEEEVVLEDGLLLFPAHLSNSLQELRISISPELILWAPPNNLNGHRTGGDQGGEGGLQGLRSLQKLEIRNCPKFLSNYMTSSSISSSCCPFPSSLRELALESVEGMETLEPLSNLTSLTRLTIIFCGEDLRCEGLLPLLTPGQLSALTVYGSQKFFVGWDPMRGKPQDEQEQLRLSVSSRPLHLMTDDVAGVLAAPFCSLLSSSLTDLTFSGNEEVERFTNEQVEALYRFTSLQALSFWSCDKLQRLPAGLNRLANLKRLSIWNCPCIRSLPKDGLPSSLQELDVSSCGNEKLKQRCRKLMGTIPEIRL